MTISTAAEISARRDAKIWIDSVLEACTPEDAFEAIADAQHDIASRWADGLHIYPDTGNRRTGRSTRAMTQCPPGAVYICPPGTKGLFVAMARNIGRADLIIMTPQDMAVNFYGFRATVVAVDHAVVATDRLIDIAHIILGR